MIRCLPSCLAVVLVFGLVAGCGPDGVGGGDPGTDVEDQDLIPGDCDPYDDTCWWDPDDTDQDEDDEGDDEIDDDDSDTDDDDDTDDDPDPPVATCFPDDSIEDLLTQFGKDQAMPVNHPSHLMGAWGDAVYQLNSDVDLQGITNTSIDLNGGVMGTLVIYGNGHTIRNYNDNRGLFQAANLILIDVNFADMVVNKTPSSVYSDDGGVLASFVICLAMRNVTVNRVTVFLPGGSDDSDVRAVGALAGRANSVHLENVDLHGIEVRLGSHSDRGFAGAIVGDLINGGLVRDVQLNGFQVSVDQSSSRTFVGGLFGMVGVGDAASDEYAILLEDVFLAQGTITNPGSGAYNLIGGVVGSFSCQATVTGVSAQSVDLVFTPAQMLFAGNMAGGAHLTGLNAQANTLQVTGNGQSGMPNVGFDNDDL
jgi:hypothetical protein